MAPHSTQNAMQPLNNLSNNNVIIITMLTIIIIMLSANRTLASTIPISRQSISVELTTLSQS